MTLELIHEPKISKLTTLGIGGSAQALATVRDIDGLDELSVFMEKQSARIIALGNGSNMLAADGKLDIVFIKVSPEKIPEPELQGTSVKVHAASALPRLLGFFTYNGLSGMEGLCGIPGTVGGAVAMNAGSYGTDISASLEKVRLWTPSKGLFWKDKTEIEFGYRHFNPGTDEFTLVWEAVFELNKADRDKIKKELNAVISRKKTTQPILERTAGCVFKNPENESAGKLLDQAGFKGKKNGGMAFSTIHANFLVNKDHGTGSQAMELLDEAVAAVKDKFNVTLEHEVVILK
ncbi:UDP-N-acetylmuramate dehydrogenase [Maridesulfovibrio bastinii]|uniref:UDP-N-acetylmuramate dehydrogenase n=1 Tax=Maridesulfovibrio bastinii TaxID=47157 RepID=UPI0003F80E93|nr:UDP-N-acetylmuramate dehydrogenase [Maridesulfovibrio bastinii]